MHDDDTYHVTRVTGQDLYGHSTRYCDPSGCSGNELYLGSCEPDTIHRGDLVQMGEWGPERVEDP